MIIDGHCHIFPYLGGACGYESASAHIAGIEGSLCRRPTTEAKYSSEPPDVRFRVGKFGRFEWVEGDVPRFRQVFPPSLQDMTASPEFMIAQMDHAGIDMAVLHNDKFYGKFNNYFAYAAREYPSRFIGLAEVNELEAYKESEILKLRHAIKDLGLKGIYFTAARFLGVGDPGGYLDKKFDLFWREVSDLKVPVIYWGLYSWNMSAEINMERLRLFNIWAERFPDIASVPVEGLCAHPYVKKNGEFRYPDGILDFFKKPNIFVDATYPIEAGTMGWDYPFPEAQRLIKQQYEELGPHKLIWGSDIPNVERNCTYKQSMTYLRDYCDFIKPKDMALILGGNLARILKIQKET